MLSEEQLRKVGGRVVEWYTNDKESRSKWEDRNKDALKLSLQVMETKTYPWPNASNVKFPLLTIAALQFSARVYPVIIKAPDLAKYRVMGRDPNGQKAARATRVSRFISYQLLEENESWEEEQDKLFIALPILGCVFKKTYYDPMSERVCSKLVLPQDLVLHYWTKDMDRSRMTEVFELYAREIKERQLRGLYLNKDITQFEHGQINEGKDTDERQGLMVPNADDETPREILECHCYWDFDGDGYAEPYVVTVDKESKLPLRIKARFRDIVSEQSLEADALRRRNFMLLQSVPSPQDLQQMPDENKAEAANYLRVVEAEVMKNTQRIKELEDQNPKIIRIEPKVYYTKYSFIPAPDGGFYDLGFGQLLGPLNESVNTLINQLIDAGTMQNGSQGWIGRGARIEGGSTRFEPYEWKRVNSSGQTLKDSIVPLPVNQPSAVLFNLLSLLISYSERVSSISDIMQGENPGQNTPAFNMQALLKEGMQVFNGVFKRIYRSFRSELRKVYLLNAEFLDPERYQGIMDADFKILQTDFGGDPKDLLPAADPNAFSNMEKVNKAQFLLQRSAMTPGYNPIVVEKRILEAMDIPDVDEVYPLTPEGQWAIPPSPNPELEIDKADMQRRVLEGKVRGETDAFKAQTDRMLKEAQTVKVMMEAGAIEQEIGLERMKMLDEQFQRDHDKTMKQIDIYMKGLDALMKEKDVEIANKTKSADGKET